MREYWEWIKHFSLQRIFPNQGLTWISALQADFFTVDTLGKEAIGLDPSHLLKLTWLAVMNSGFGPDNAT